MVSFLSVSVCRYVRVYFVGDKARIVANHEMQKNCAQHWRHERPRGPVREIAAYRQANRFTSTNERVKQTLPFGAVVWIESCLP